MMVVALIALCKQLNENAHVCIYIYTYIHIRTSNMFIHVDIYGQASGVPSPPAPPNGMVWYCKGGGGLGWRVRRGAGAVGAAAGETARRHRPGQHSTQALRKP